MAGNLIFEFGKCDSTSDEKSSKQEDSEDDSGSSYTFTNTPTTANPLDI